LGAQGIQVSTVRVLTRALLLALAFVVAARLIWSVSYADGYRAAVTATWLKCFQPGKE